MKISGFLTKVAFQLNADTIINNSLFKKKIFHVLISGGIWKYFEIENFRIYGIEMNRDGQMLVAKLQPSVQQPVLVQVHNYARV